VPPYAILALPLSLIALGFIVAVIRANKDDLPAIVRAMRGIRPGDDGERDDPPSLPKP
jgi:hypothetical protein